MNAPRRAVVLINVGTPDGTDVASVRRYLAEFLSDPKVLDAPRVVRWALLHFVILPFRPRHSAHAYQQIWTPQGSPLLTISRAQREGLAARLPEARVLLAMRYGRPSLAEAVRVIAEEQLDDVLLVPLYPQYATASTASALEAAQHALAALPFKPRVTSVPPFFADPGFLRAWESRLQEALAQSPGVEHVVFSYHGLPEHQVQATDATGQHCLRSGACCDALVDANRDCYRAQCFATSRALAQRAGLASVSTTFQSRLGRVPWIAPFTDLHLPELAARGVRRVMVACPSFVSDCLETLEEVGVRLRAQFLAAGGESLILVPCLNDSPAWLDALEGICRHTA